MSKVLPAYKITVFSLLLGVSPLAGLGKDVYEGAQLNSRTCTCLAIKSGHCPVISYMSIVRKGRQPFLMAV